MRAARWLIDLPTRLHLWSAEHELRHSPAPQGADDHARQHNLDVLRAYRRSRRFPHNTVATRPTPVFIDDDGRRCAVAHLMIESGASDAARHVAAKTPYARIHELDPAPLDDWAQPNGLTRRDLTRIQPEYCYEPGGCGPGPWWRVAEIALLVLMSVGAATIVANLGYLVKAGSRHLAARLGRAIGWALLAINTATLYALLSAFNSKPGVEALAEWGLIGLIVGLACILAASRSTRRERRLSPAKGMTP